MRGSSVNYIIRLCLFFAAIAVGFIFQISNVLAIYNVNPNLILIGLISAVVYFHTTNIRLRSLILIGLGLMVLGLLWTPFWVIEILILVFLSVIAIFIIEKLTGSDLIDGIILLIITGFLFYIILFIFQGGPLLWTNIIFESTYNLILGGLAIFFLNFR